MNNKKTLNLFKATGAVILALVVFLTCISYTTKADDGDISGYYCSRAAFVKMVWLAENAPSSSGTVNFTDTGSSSDYLDSLRWAVNKGIVSGYSNNTFKPYNNITRVQACTILWKAAGSPSPGRSSSSYSDVSAGNFSKAEYNAILWVEAQGLSDTSYGGAFRPNSALTNLEATTMVCTYMNYFGKSKLKNQTVVMIGDSDANGSGANGEGWVYWLNRVAGCNTVASYIGGSGFTKRGYGGGNAYGMNFTELLYDASYKCNPAYVSKVIICGGFNDYSYYRSNGADAFKKAITNTLSHAKSLYPNATIYAFPLFTDLPFDGVYYPNSGSNVGGTISNSSIKVFLNTLKTAYDAFKSANVVTSFDIMPIFQNGGRYSNGISVLGTGDGMHVNSEGSRAMAQMLMIYSNPKTYTSTQPAPVGSGFSDVSSSESYYKPITWAVNNGIVKGYDDKTFRPEESCTRQQFVVILWRMNGKPSASSSVKFSDVNSSMSSYGAIQWAVSKGIIVGYKDGTFRPTDTVTRQQVAVMLWRWAGKHSASSSTSFKDVSSSESAYKAIQWCANVGIIKGYSDGTYRPANKCTRAQIVTMLYRYTRDYLGQPV